MTQRQIEVPWSEADVPNAGALGANINHDEQSKNFPFLLPAKAPTLRQKSHRNYGPPLQQNGIGACTGFTGANYLNTKPHRPSGRKMFRNDDGFLFYSEATKIDPWLGTWYPPLPGTGEDTGSDALSVCKVLQRMGLVREYRWTFGLEMTLQALMESPVMIGIEWYEGFDTPDKTGRVKISGDVRGRHEVLLLGLDPKLKLVKCLNSWGSWGWRGEGYFTFSWDELGYLLERQGDAVIPLS